MKHLAFTLAATLLTATAAFAQTNHGTMNHGTMNHGTMNHGAGKQMEGAVHAKAVVNSMAEGTANVTHGPIPEIGWPAMTMDLAVAPDAQIMGEVAAGDSVILMLIKGDDGMYVIGAMMPE
jgi:Cu(I)/Ag(I) efflux system periplasmic protein CusF